MKKPGIVFMGTPDFAVPSLRIIVENQYDIKALVTQPDRPKGRGGKLGPPPAKQEALKYGLRILQPVKLSGEFIKVLQSIKPDLIVVVAYGKILPKKILKIPPLGCINVHASLLPKYRGAAPIHRAVMNGDRVTGVTTMYMSEGMDTGDIILSGRTEIKADDTVGTLHDRLAKIGSQVLLETIELVVRGEVPRKAQDDQEASYAPPLGREEEIIDWEKEAEKIFNQIRGMNPWPGAYTFWKEKRLKIWKSEVIKEEAGFSPGEIIELNHEGIVVGTGKGILQLLEVQLSGAKKMSASAFLRGNKLSVGDFLGGLKSNEDTN